MKKTSFARIKPVIEIPQLLEMQRASYREFLQDEVPVKERKVQGLQASFADIFPIISTDESLFSYKLWTALDRTRYMQSSKTFVMVDRPFWKDKDPNTGRDVMSTTLTDRLTRQQAHLFEVAGEFRSRRRPSRLYCGCALASKLASRRVRPIPRRR